MPPAEWLRAALAPRLTGDAAETFIDVLADERSYQRLAFALGARWAAECSAQRPRLFADEDDVLPTTTAPRH